MRRDKLKRTIGIMQTTLMLVVVLVAHADRVVAERTPGYMLAVVGIDNNLYVYDADGKNPFPITSDATPDVSLYHWPTWSTDGRLAYFGVSADTADPYSLGIFVVDTVKTGAQPKTAYKSKTDIFTYAYWAPFKLFTEKRGNRLPESGSALYPASRYCWPRHTTDPG